MIYCTHYDCRCETAAELALMAQLTGRNDILLKAVEVHSAEVRCRHLPRPKPPLIHAPLPSSRKDDTQ